MRIVVCLKRLARAAGISPAAARPDPMRMAREALGPADHAALKAALRLGREHAVPVTCITLGPAGARDALCLGLALGADDALLLRDDEIEDYDAYGAALIVGRALRRIEWSLVLCGDRAADDGSGLFAAALANEVGAPYLAGLVDVEVPAGCDHAVGKRKLTGALREIWRVSLPAVVSVPAAGSEIGHVPMGRFFLARRREIPEKSARAEWDGMTPLARTQVRQVSPARQRVKRRALPSASLSPAERIRMLTASPIGANKQTARIRADPQEAARQALRLLEERGLLPDDGGLRGED